MRRRRKLKDEQPFSRTITQLAKDEGLSRGKIYEAIKSGQLPARKLGRKTMVLTEDWQSFVRKLPAYQAAA